ncbi:tyrosine-type recombinase/integrase [Paraburkholderia fungorum]|uniref:tyrosine-type recombinase/integrase n=1 Tax=Paraburkholderia fungorum TaxID=134537 RepID=UPI00288A2BAC|nr:tyrosine-type recombinase/integrase [Paraburkholderia fungorum]
MDPDGDGQRPTRATGADAAAADGRAGRLSAAQAGALHAGHGASGHAADRPPENRQAAVARCARAALQGHLHGAAALLRPAYPGAAADLARASTHWLRHTHANHALDAGDDLRDVRTGLGHASRGTTTLYTKGDAVRQYRAVERFLMRRWRTLPPYRQSDPAENS